MSFKLYSLFAFGVGCEPEQQEHKGHPGISSSRPFKEAVVLEGQRLMPLADDPFHCHVRVCTLHDDGLVRILFCLNV